MIIVIDGNIGSGKSTLLSKLSSHFHDFKKILIKHEDLETWKPYLEQFNHNQKSFSLSFQYRVLLSHIQTPKLLSDFPFIISERSPLSCLHVFGSSLVDNDLMSELDYKLLLETNDHFGWIPTIRIYIQTPPDICFERMITRNRDTEDVLPLSYLQSIHDKYEDIYSNYHIEHSYLIDGSKSPDEIFSEVLPIINSHISL